MAEFYNELKIMCDNSLPSEQDSFVGAGTLHNINLSKKLENLWEVGGVIAHRNCVPVILSAQL